MSPQTAHFDVMGESRGRTTTTRTRFPALSVQETPTQGQDRDMGSGSWPSTKVTDGTLAPLTGSTYERLPFLSMV